MGLTGNGLAGQSQSGNGISQDSCMEHFAQESCHVVFDVFAHIGVTCSFHRGSSQVLLVFAKSSTLLRVRQICGTCKLCLENVQYLFHTFQDNNINNFYGA